jgi:HD-like signal output (HDOD) protein/CheY-like chemotaxis protein
MTHSRLRRVLFVDDELPIVDGHRRVLRAHRGTWDVTTTTSSRAALAMLDTDTFDVLVSDMRMPEMDGAALLAAAKEKCPATVRILLSGQSDAVTGLRMAGVAHQFLSKPTTPGLLVSVLNRVVATRDALAAPDLLAAIGGLDALPSPPRLCRRLAAIAASSDLTVEALADEIEPDPAVVLKLLQLVNSAFFGLRREMSNVPEAIAYLGVDLVKNLVTSFSIIGAMPVRAARFDIDAFQRRSLEVGLLARFIAGPGVTADVCFAAGLLHAIGVLVLAFAAPDTYDDLAHRAASSGRSLEAEAVARGGCDPRMIGAYLLNLWGLPAPVVEAILEQPRAPTGGGATLQGADALHLALRLLDGPDEFDGPDERAWLHRLGLTARLPGLVARAAEFKGA